MVSKASDDFPDPLTPVTMISLPEGSVTSMFFRLCVRAPRTTSGPRAGRVGCVPKVANFSQMVSGHRTTRGRAVQAVQPWYGTCKDEQNMKRDEYEEYDDERVSGPG